MALKINTLRGEAKENPKAKIAGERLWYNADATALVRDGDVRARTLAVAAGHRMHPDLIRRFGIKDGKIAASGENKALSGTSNKKG